MQSSSSAATNHYSLPKRKIAPPGSNEVAPRAKSRRSEGEESADLQTPSTHINDLPKELLGQVIRELEPRERIFTESVCCRWSRVSRAYGWLNYRLIANEQWSDEWKEAYLAKHQGENAEYGLRFDFRIWDGPLCSLKLQCAPRNSGKSRELKCLLSRCAPTMREIDLSGINDYGLDGRVCVLLTGEMKMLETLALDGIQLNSSQLVALGTRLPWLKEISLRKCLSEHSKHAESALAAILSSCRCLERLVLSGNHALTGELFIPKLPATLHLLELFGCLKLHHSAVDSLLATCGGNLRALCLGAGPVGSTLDGWTSAHFERLFTGLSRLETLCLLEYPHISGDGSGRSVDEIEARYRAIGALTNLRTLILRCTECVTDEVVGTDSHNSAYTPSPRNRSVKVLNQLVAGCQCFERLELLCCSDAPISKRAIGRLAQLPKLTTLELHQHQSIDDGTLAELAKGPARLRTFGIRVCAKVTDKGIASLLDGCGGELRELNVYHCPLVTQATVTKLEALYGGASSSNSAEEKRVFVLNADLDHLGFERKEFHASQQTAN